MPILDRSPSRSCCWNTGRPVGLIRSPMIANGWSGPIATVFVALDNVVCMASPGHAFASARRRRSSSFALTTAAEASAA
jgi:hypothetical protein